MEFPWPWPPPHRLHLYSSDVNGCRVEFAARSDRSLEVLVKDRLGAIMYSVVSQPIEPSASGPFHLGLTFSPTGQFIYINAEQLKRQSEDSAAKNVEPSKFAFTSEFQHNGVSLTDPAANPACAEWVARRSRKFQRPAIKPHYREKTLIEQLDDLLRAREVLRFVRGEVLLGRVSLAGVLATEIRALVHWRKDDAPDNQYNPLLLRIASKIQLALPVYASVNWASATLEHHAGSDLVQGLIAPSIYPSVLPFALVDAQECLSQQCARMRHPATGAVESISLKWFIARCSHVLGSAHYDEDTSDILLAVQRQAMMSESAVVQLLTNTAECLIDLIDWVLLKFREHSLIPEDFEDTRRQWQ